MPIGRFEYDPGSDGWFDPARPELGTMNLADVTEGDYYSVGRNVYYRPDPSLRSQLVGRIAFQAGSRLTVTRERVVLLENNIRQRELNRETLSNALYSATATGSFELPSGTRIEVTTDYLNLAPYGERLYVPSSGVTDRQDYRTLRAGEEPPPGYRLATAAETFQRGVVAYILRNNAEQIRRLAAEGVEVPGVGLTTNVYIVAQYVAAQLELTGTITYDLSARVGR